MGSVTWGPEEAEVYDKAYSAMFEPSVLDPMAGLLAELARGGDMTVARPRGALQARVPGG